MAADFLAALRPLFDCLTDGFCIADVDGRLLYANAAAGRLLGTDAQAVAAGGSLCGLLCESLEGPHGVNSGNCPLKVPRGTTDAITFHGKFKPSGRDLRMRCLRVRLPGVERRFIILEDVSEQVERGRRKEEWRQMLAHDFRAPQTIMYGVLRSLEDLGLGHRLDEDDIALIESGVRSSRRLDDLISSYLDISRLEDGAIPVRTEPVNVDLLLAGIVDEELEVAKSRGLSLTAGRPTGLNALADPELLRRAVTNLIGNAMKFTPARGHIRAYALRDGAQVLIRVEDDGPGISAQELPRVFERFYQGSHHGNGHGLGLGLTFCRAALRAMGGEAEAASEPAKGSVFTLRLPAPLPEAGP